MYARLHMHETPAGSENRRGFPLASESEISPATGQGEWGSGRGGGERKEPRGKEEWGGGIDGYNYALAASPACKYGAETVAFSVDPRDSAAARRINRAAVLRASRPAPACVFS